MVRRRIQRGEYRGGTGMLGDEYALSFEGSINQLRQVVLGFGNAVGRHAQNMAIQ
jgi:hypothetical protein